MEEVVAPDTGKSTVFLSEIMPAVTVRIAMPQGAAVPAQAAPQASQQTAPAQAQ